MRGGLVKRGRTWSAVLYLGTDAQTGRKRQRWVRLEATTRKEAETELATLVTKHAEGTLPDATQMTVGDLLTRWLEVARGTRRASTVEAYREAIDYYLRPRLGHLRLQKLRPLAIQEAYARLREAGGRRGRPLSARTVQHAHAVLHRALTMAVKWNLLAVNPADRVEPPRPSPKEPRVLNEAETRRLLDAAAGTVWYLPLLLLAATGCRRAEALAVRWADVDLERGQLAIRQALFQAKDGAVTVVPTKANRGRLVTLPTLAVEALRGHRAAQREARFAAGPAWRADLDLVLPYPGTPGEPWGPESFTSGFRAWARRHGFGGLRVHALRHGHVSHLIRAGVSLKAIASRVGHTQVSTTSNIYAHLLGGEDAAAAEALDAALRREGAGA
jgi:integrase